MPNSTTNLYVATYYNYIAQEQQIVIIAEDNAKDALMAAIAYVKLRCGRDHNEENIDSFYRISDGTTLSIDEIKEKYNKREIEWPFDDEWQMSERAMDLIDCIDSD